VKTNNKAKILELRENGFTCKQHRFTVSLDANKYMSENTEKLQWVAAAGTQLTSDRIHLQSHFTLFSATFARRPLKYKQFV